MVDEDAMGLVDAVAVAILVPRDLALRQQLAVAVGRLHVAANFEDIHSPVAVEGNLGRLLNVRIGEDRLHLEAGL